MRPSFPSRAYLPCLGLIFAALMTLAACGGAESPRPRPAGMATAAGPVADATAAVATNTAVPTPSATPLPTATSTPSPTPTAIAVSGQGALAAGRLVVGVTRSEAEVESIWQLATGATPAPLHEAVMPGLWDCAAGEAARCLAITSGGGLLALAPDGSAPPQLLPVPAGFELNAAGGMAAPAALALAPDAGRAAVSVPGRTTVLGLPDGRAEASLLVTATVAMAWSPNGEALALVHDSPASQQALTLWRADSDVLTEVAIMGEIDYLHWSPDSGRLAFSGRPRLDPEAEGVSDVFVAFLRSGEVSNMSESGLFNQDEPGAMAAWAPEWEASGEALRYRRGAPDDPGRQEVVRHPLASLRATSLWPATEAGLFGVLDSPDGRWQARVIDVDGDQGQALEVRLTGEPWAPEAAMPMAGVKALRWVPFGPDGDSYGLLLQESQALRWYDVTAAAWTDLATACANCALTRAVWLPQ